MLQSPVTLFTKLRRKGLRHCVRVALVSSWNALRYRWHLLWERNDGLLFRATVRLLRALKIRFPVGANLIRIGHLACEPDAYIKEGLLGMRPCTRLVVLAPADRIPNRCLLDYWRKYLTIASTPRWCRLLERFSFQKELGYPFDGYVTSINETARYTTVQTAYGSRPPLLRLTPDHWRRGLRCLRELGVPEGAWFVGVHCRERGYAPYESIHNFRDVDVANYLPAMRAIVERGGWCIRLGDPTMKPLPPLPGVIDYAHSPLRSDWMDVFLCAACRFFLGSSSGLYSVASVFGVPCAVANHAPLSVVLAFTAADIGIPKLCWTQREGRYLTFPELLDGPLGNARYVHQFDAAGVTVVENSADDIRDLALEMLDVIEGRAVYTTDDERLQERLRGLLRPGHYTYGSQARMGRDFLRKYQWLLLPEQAARAAG
jgi:putative glycosyltransferase (TIGR04372 family)